MCTQFFVRFVLRFIYHTTFLIKYIFVFFILNFQILGTNLATVYKTMKEEHDLFNFLVRLIAKKIFSD
jgi:hypothetical protein